MTQLIIAIIIIAILLPIYNGLIINWKFAKGLKEKKLSGYWHKLNALIRIVLVFGFLRFWDAVGVLLIHWIFFDGILNFVRGKDFFYEGSKDSGTGSQIDIWLSKKQSIILKIICFILGILILIL